MRGTCPSWTRWGARPLAAAWLLLAAASPALAAAEGKEPPFQHYVPSDKHLSEAWRQSLFAKGTPTVWTGEALDGIGMPCGGIAAGQVYLRGDGTLTYWRIFNRWHNTGYGRECYGRPIPPSKVAQGFAVAVEADGQTAARPLSRDGFADIQFIGEYPIGRVRYRAEDFPLRVELEAFSPFIPLDAKRSAFPAALFHITVTNASEGPLRARVAGWLENAVLIHSAKQVRALRRTQVLRQAGRTVLLHTAKEAPPPEPSERPRELIVLADFEGADYGDWTAEGEAFGTGPARGTLPEQQEVSGFRGKGLVNTYLGKDGPHGTLTSPPFRITRRFVQFLIGGGHHAGQTCINLLVDGQVVRTAVGKNNERLEWAFWNVEDLAGKEARIQIVDRASGGWGHINIDQIELTDTVRAGPSGPIDQLNDYGSLALTLAAPAAAADEAAAVLRAAGPALKGLQPAADAELPLAERRLPALVGPAGSLAPGARHTSTWVVSWHFPNLRHSWGITGRRYATWFADAREAAAALLDDHDRLARTTRLWHDTYYDSTLPHWLLDRLHYTVSNLATGTTQWWANGRFWAWEGVGCCGGTCTHVWNYAHALARLFPELERSARAMQDFGQGFDPKTGLVGFRSNRAYAADGQCGTILKALREHQMSADAAFLRTHWPRIKKALQFLIARDGDGDGLIEDSQHNTFDINFHGPNTFVGSLYLAALRAGEAMATEMGDEDFAATCRRIFHSGSRQSVERLWDGEYFIQLVDLDKHPKFQYARGCLSDQLFGQGWARQLGLGYLYPEANVRGALEAVWKYNWAPDVGPHNAVHRPFRVFARPGEPGLFTCTWPKSPHLGANAVRYKNEVWTGIEYQVAGHMIWEGMLTEGLSIIRGIHERYQPPAHNPYNEVECGDHYARALASWGAYLALAGFEYHGPKGHLAFAPRITPGDFRAAFTAAEGWGTYSQQRDQGGARQVCRVDLKWGTLRLTRFAVALPARGGIRAAKVTVSVAGTPAKARSQVADGRLVVTFAEPVRLAAGQRLEVVAAWDRPAGRPQR